MGPWLRRRVMRQTSLGPTAHRISRDYGLKATFFAPGWTAEKYRDRIEAIFETVTR